MIAERALASRQPAWLAHIEAFVLPLLATAAAKFVYGFLFLVDTLKDLLKNRG